MTARQCEFLSFVAYRAADAQRRPSLSLDRGIERSIDREIRAAG